MWFCYTMAKLRMFCDFGVNLNSEKYRPGMLANTSFFCRTCARHGEISLLSVFESTMSCEAYGRVLSWGKLQWVSMRTIIIGLCPDNAAYRHDRGADKRIDRRLVVGVEG